MTSSQKGERGKSRGISGGSKGKKLDRAKKIMKLEQRLGYVSDNYSSDKSTPTAVVVNESRYSTGGSIP